MKAININDVREDIEFFAIEMENKLREKDNDRGDGWKTATVRNMFARLKGELGELESALAECDPEEAKLECSDVANFAMFIYSILRDRETE